MSAAWLQARNEELARKSAAISEEDLEAVRAEFEARLGAAERKVYALSKERDALRRGADKLNSANDLVKEKDAIIQQAGPAPHTSPRVQGTEHGPCAQRLFVWHRMQILALKPSLTPCIQAMAG